MSVLVYRWGERAPSVPGVCGFCGSPTVKQLFLTAGAEILRASHFCEMCFEQVRALRIDPDSRVLVTEKDAATGAYRWTGVLAARAEGA